MFFINTNLVLNENAIFSSVGFYRIFDNLNDTYFKLGTQINLFKMTDFAMYSFPYVVNGTFACEIAMKAAMTETAAKACRHNLCKIYNNNDFPEICKDEIEQSMLNKGFNKNIFLTTLSESSNLFEQWRYYYENGHEASIPANFESLVKSICLTMYNHSEIIKCKER